MAPLTLTGDPERDDWPSVEDPGVECCPYCEAMPHEPHSPACPMSDGSHEANDVRFCDACGHSYVTCCGCDEEGDR